jgi:hypothetical protein
MREATVVCLLIVFLFGPLAPTVVAAQDPPAALPAGPTPRVRPGQMIWVTTSDGRELSGSVRSVSASVLEMTGPGGELSIPLRDVRMIEAGDSMKNGVRNGAIIGGASLGIYFGLLSYGLRCERDCGADYSSTRDTIGAVAFGAGAGAGAGALVGLLVDHLRKGRQVVYAAAPTESTAWEILPVVAKGGLRVYATVSW